MTVELHPYAEYVESGISWLGDIPSNWRVVRIKYALREYDDRSLDGSGQLLSLSRNHGLVVRSEISSRDHTAKTLVGYKRHHSGQVVMNRMQAWSGMFGTSDVSGLVSPDYATFRVLNDYNARFIVTRLKSPDMVSRFAMASRGIGTGFNRLYSDDFGAIAMSIPSPQDQIAIVKYVQHVERKVGAAIRAKRQLIGLLTEQKRAIVHQFVTGDLTPDAPRIITEISGLESIPEHWEISPLKRVASIQTGITLGKNYAGERVKEFPYLRVANVQAGRLDLSSIAALYIPKNEATRSTLRPGDVLMTEGGDPDKLGRGCVWNGEIANCLHQNHVFSVRPRAILNPYFLEAVLGTLYAQTYFLVTAKQTTNLASTNKTKIGAFRVPLPPVEEQLEILASIKSATAPLDTAIARAEREISLLSEYQVRLTADVVTGKLDVREVAASLPAVAANESSLALDKTPVEGLPRAVDQEDNIATEESM